MPCVKTRIKVRSTSHLPARKYRLLKPNLSQHRDVLDTMATRTLAHDLHRFATRELQRLPGEVYLDGLHMQHDVQRTRQHHKYIWAPRLLYILASHSVLPTDCYGLLAHPHTRNVCRGVFGGRLAGISHAMVEGCRHKVWEQYRKHLGFDIFLSKGQD